MSARCVFWCKQIVFRDTISPGMVEVQNGLIVSTQTNVTKDDAQRWASETGAIFQNLHNTNHPNSCLSPGLVDVHVHISALGRNWEGYTSATKAAAAGGITTLLGMPLNSLPPTTSPESFALEQAQAQHDDIDLYVDVGLWGGIVPGNCNPDALAALLDSGVFGLKAFLSPLPPAAGYEAVTPDQLLEAARICGRYDKKDKPILVHSELMTEHELHDALQSAFQDDGTSCQSYRAHVKSRPPEWERRAVEVVCEAASFCPMHIVHLSDAGCLDIIEEAKHNETKRLTAETCPHYLLLDDSVITDSDTRAKCFPPIRDKQNRLRLWSKGMKGGLIDMIASDHSPCEPQMRCRQSGNMRDAWGGLSGLQYQLPATWTEASDRECTVLDIARWWSQNPCELVGISNMKGSIEPGKLADFCWWDPTFRGAPTAYSKEHHRWTGDTVYASNPDLKGRVLGTWSRGIQVYDGFKDEHLDIGGKFLLDH